MKKVFLFEHHAKTSKNCDKYSTSVSRETLVGGTTTAGTTHEQTQCLSKGSAGYRFCKTMRFSYENLMDYLLQTSPVFRLVTIFSLVAVLSIGIISESWAEIIGCNDGDTSCEACGEGCNWSYNTETKELNLSGNGRIYNNIVLSSQDSQNLPWNNFMDEIQTVKFAAGSTLAIGAGAFYKATSLKSVDMPDVTRIGRWAFEYTSSLTSVDMPNVTKIESGAFSGASNLSYIGLPRQMDSEGFLTDENGNRILYETSDPHLSEYACTVYGGGTWRATDSVCIVGTKVLNSANEFSSTQVPGCSASNRSACGSCGDGYVMPGRGCVSECENGYTANTETKQCVRDSAPADSSTPSADAQPTAASCANDGKVLKGNACVSSCGESFRLNDGECDRIRYTPAEAAQYLKDTDNEIIMTFKVNR